MKKNLIDLKNYQPNINEVGEIKIDTSRPRRKPRSLSRSYLALLGYFVVIVLILLGLVLPAFRPIEEQQGESSAKSPIKSSLL